MVAESPSRGECSRAVVTLDLSSATELASAQQRMRLLCISRVRVRPLPDGARPPEPAQIDKGNLRTLSFPVNINAPDNTDCAPAHQMHTILARVVMALRRGKNRLTLIRMLMRTLMRALKAVVRNRSAVVALLVLRVLTREASHCQWHGQKWRDWDSGVQDAVGTLCRSNGGETGCCIPELLYFSHDDETNSGPMNGCNFGPWALLSYFESRLDGVDADGALQSALIIEVSGIKYSNGSNGKGKADERMNNLLRVLGQCIDALDCEWDSRGGKPPPLPPVLCHMDLQPQNLAFAHAEYSGDSCSNQNAIHTAKDCSVAAVMDWEEACYADPRFELLLVCRKVLATREQADSLWQMYSDRVQKLGAQLSSQRKEPMRWEVGPLEPWLKLETVHSLCTLLLQAMDLLGGGRSPWETKPDLWGKIDRERQRLAKVGWTFCENT
ncbi:hypothetical protein ACHAXT_009408 [Thalassiosira profunda]